MPKTKPPPIEPDPKSPIKTPTKQRRSSRTTNKLHKSDYKHIVNLAKSNPHYTELSDQDHPDNELQTDTLAYLATLTPQQIDNISNALQIQIGTLRQIIDTQKKNTSETEKSHQQQITDIQQQLDYQVERNNITCNELRDQKENNQALSIEIENLIIQIALAHNSSPATNNPSTPQETEPKKTQNLILADSNGKRLQSTLTSSQSINHILSPPTYTLEELRTFARDQQNAQTLKVTDTITILVATNDIRKGKNLAIASQQLTDTITHLTALNKPIIVLETPPPET
jgi:hypothetical protein